MAKGMIYMVDSNDELTAMSPSAPLNEDRMQALVARHPELITDDDGDLLLIRREHPIADSDDTGGRWSVDHLFVTKTGVPVLVELKRAVDTRLRREVVGQMLDYAANATAYWQAGRIAGAFATTTEAAGKDPDEVLTAFLEDKDPSEFWAQVDANFTAGRVKLVFVADTIPIELARIVEFLNDQMRADVRAVELRWFESAAKGITTLSPRIIGETARTTAIKAASRGALPPIDAQQWIDKNIAPAGLAAVEGAHHFVAMVEALGGTAAPPSTQGSIYAGFHRGSKWMYPMFLVKTAGGQVQLALGNLMYDQRYQSDEARQDLYDRLSEIVGGMPKRPLNGFPPFAVTILNNPAKLAEVSAFLADVVNRD